MTRSVAVPRGEPKINRPRRPIPGGEHGVLSRHLDRVEQLERRVAELEVANQDLSALAAHLAHDLRSPLQAVTGFSELLIRREGVRLDETSQSFLANVLSAAEGMKELIEGLLEDRRSSCGALQPTTFEASELVTGVLRRLGRKIDDVGAGIRVETLPSLRADRMQVGRVIQNLLVNALRATAHRADPVVTIAARRRYGAWELSVTDNGVGVPAADRERIFGLFERGDDERDGTGRGMGLAICRTVVERHGGRIAVEKAPGGGSRFSFTLPDDPPATGATPGEPRPLPAG